MFKNLLWELPLVVLSVVLYLYGLQVSSNRPHHITVKAFGLTTISDFWTTNNVYISWENGGCQGCQFDNVHAVTNEYWHKYTFFK